MTVEQDVARLRAEFDAFRRGPVPHHGDTHHFSGADPLTHGRLLFYGNAAGNTVGAGATNYLGFGPGNLNATEGVVQIPVAALGVLRKLRLITGSAQPGTGSMTVTARVNGADTALTTTIAAGAAAGTFTDLVNGVTVTPGDLIDLELTNNAAGASAGVRGFSLEMLTR